MGRLGRDFSQRQKKGKGRKTKKQPPPEFKNLDLPKEISKTSMRRQKKREVKKIAKQLTLDEKKSSRSKNADDEFIPSGETEWLPEDIEDPDESLEEIDSNEDQQVDSGKSHLKKDVKKLPLPGLTGSDDDESDEELRSDDVAVDDEFLESVGDEDDYSEEGDEMEIEKASKKIDAKRQKMKELMQQESEEEEEEEDVSEGDEAEEDEAEDGNSDIELNLDTAPPAELPGQVLKHEELLERIHANVDAYRNPKSPAAKGRKRSEVRSQLVSDLSTYYGYNEFMIGKFLDLFPGEIIEALDANEVDRPMTIRANTLITRRRDLHQSLINRGVNLEPIGKWSQLGLVIFDSKIPIGATPEYLAGHYILQGGSSLLPVMALDPKENERILDMCAAPGGKTTHIAQQMRNTGTVIANDVHKERCAALAANIHRMGVTNTAVCCLDGRQFPKLYKDFDRVLLDAPCSGTGVISKDPACKTSRDLKDIKRTAHLQKELILAAIDACDANKSSSADGSTGGGVIVYSTCSVLVEENEDVVAYALRKRHVKLIETGLEFGDDGFTRFGEFHFVPQMKLCKRYYPHTNNLDGFFVAKLLKVSNEKKICKEDKNMDEEAVDLVNGNGAHSDDDSGSDDDGKRKKVAGKPTDKQQPKKQAPKAPKRKYQQGKKEYKPRSNKQQKRR